MSGDQPDGKTCLTDVLSGCLLCNNAELGVDGHSPISDPLEQALLAAGKAEGMDKRQLETRFARVREIAFDSTAKLMGTVHRADDDFVMWVKGAPEEVLEACSTSVQTDGVNASLTPEKRAFRKSRTDQMAARGMRVLAVATRTLQSPQAATYADLKFLGLVGLIDPPRRDVPQAITQCRSAGIRVITQ